MMKTTILVLLSLSFLQTLLAAETLVIRTKYAPDDCETTRKSIKGDRVLVHYTASIDKSSETGEIGMVFDSSYRRSEPESIVIGGGKVTQGFSDGLIDMCAGEKRTVVIPPQLGFGDQGALPNIPGGATLRYEIECKAVLDPRKKDLLHAGDAWQDIDLNKDWVATYEEIFRYWTVKRQQKEIPKSVEGGNLFEKDDKDKDGVVTWEEFSGPKGAIGPPGWNGNDLVSNNPLYPLKLKAKKSETKKVEQTSTTQDEL